MSKTKELTEKNLSSNTSVNKSVQHISEKTAQGSTLKTLSGTQDGNIYNDPVSQNSKGIPFTKEDRKRVIKEANRTNLFTAEYVGKCLAFYGILYAIYGSFAGMVMYLYTMGSWHEDMPTFSGQGTFIGVPGLIMIPHLEAKRESPRIKYSVKDRDSYKKYIDSIVGHISKNQGVSKELINAPVDVFKDRRKREESADTKEDDNQPTDTKEDDNVPTDTEENNDTSDDTIKEDDGSVAEANEDVPTPGEPKLLPKDEIPETKPEDVKEDTNEEVKNDETKSIVDDKDINNEMNAKPVTNEPVKFESNIKCSIENDYGYSSGEPCFLLYLNNVLNWNKPTFNNSNIPPKYNSDRHNFSDVESLKYTIPVSCSLKGKEGDGNKHFTYDSYGIIDQQNYYPVSINTDVTKKPYMFVQLKNIPKNVKNTVTCQYYVDNEVTEVEAKAMSYSFAVEISE
uniref:SUN domain-containing protein n=1 Tax=Parastrongyloides trichosuri TaxID=131310 RepID=A0A0N4ZL87_PARTI